jgi:hypothetical protein
MSSSTKSFTLAGRVPMKTGCRWSELLSIFSPSPLRPAFSRLPRFGGFILPPLPPTKSVTGIVPSLSFGDFLTGAFTLPLVISRMAGSTTDHQSTFVRSPFFQLSSSRSFNDFWLRQLSMRTMTANNAMHTDSAGTLRFHVEDHWRGAGDGER